MRMIFEEDFLPECSLSAPIPDVRSRLQGPVLADAESHPEPVPEEGPMFVKAIKCIADKEFSERRSAVLKKALQKWRILLVRFEAECPAGVFEGHADSLGPMMGNKSPLTILERANSLLSLLRWADSLGSCTVFSEATVGDSCNTFSRMKEHRRDRTSFLPCALQSLSLSVPLPSVSPEGASALRLRCPRRNLS